jgi:hypothetical protein
VPAAARSGGRVQRRNRRAQKQQRGGASHMLTVSLAYSF